MKFDAELTAVAKCSTNRLRPVMQVYNYLVDAVRSEIFGDVTNEWFSENWYCRLGAVFSERPEACAVSGGKNNRTHRLRSGSLRRVAHDEVERARGNFTKSCVAVEGHCYADRRVLTGELKATFEQAVVEFVDVKWS